MLSHFSHDQLFATVWTVAHLIPLSILFSRQEYCSGLSCPSSGDLLALGTELMTHVFCTPALAVGFFTTSTTWEAHIYMCVCVYICMYGGKMWGGGRSVERKKRPWKQLKRFPTDTLQGRGLCVGWNLCHRSVGQGICLLRELCLKSKWRREGVAGLYTTIQQVDGSKSWVESCLKIAEFHADMLTSCTWQSDPMDYVFPLNFKPAEIKRLHKMK